MNAAELTQRIHTLYPDARVDVNGEGCSFEIHVITPEFTGMKSLNRQRSIMNLFSPEITTGKLHALTVKAKAPEEL